MVSMSTHRALSLLNPFRCYGLSQLPSAILGNRCAFDFKNCSHGWEYLLYNMIYLGMESKSKHKFHSCFIDTYSLSLEVIYTLSWAHLGLGCDPLCEVRHGIFHLWLPVRDENMSNCGAAQSLKFCIKDVQSVPYPRRQFTSDRQRLLSPGPNALSCVLQDGNVLLKIFRDQFSPNFILHTHNNTNYSSHSNKVATKNSGCLAYLSTLRVIASRMWAPSSHCHLQRSTLSKTLETVILFTADCFEVQIWFQP